MKEIAEKIMAYAYNNYNKSGWDYIVETYTLDEIVDELKEEGISTYEKALKHFAWEVDLWDEGRRYPNF